MPDHPLDRPDVYEESFRGSTDGIVITDTEGLIVTANPAWLRLYGYELDEVRGQSTRLIKSEHSSREMYEYMWRQIRDDAVGYWRGEIVNRKRSGEEVPVHLSITPIRREGGIVGYMGIGLDVTARKQAEELRSLYDMVVRHDLKAPLASVQSILQTLAEGFVGDLSPKQRDLIERALSQSQRMRALIDTSLDVEKLKRRTLQLAPEETDLFDLARDSIETLSDLATRREVDVVLRATDRPATASDRLVLLVDPVHLQRAVENLVKNAVEASPRGGSVRVTVQATERRAHLRVHNAGAPIPPDVRATLFHPFSTYGKRGGTGLGVYGVKLTMDAMGGEVRYESGEGGTTFELALPRDEAVDD